MFSWLANAWRVPELRRRVMFTGLILGLYRLGSWMPAPGVDSKSIQDFFGSGGRGSSILGLLNLFSGSALSRFSIFALGIMPYVTASIILQLMTVVVPTLEQLQKEGESGYAKINQYTRYLTVALAAAQASGYAYLFHQQGAIPVIFAAALLALPQTVGSFAPKTQTFINQYFSSTSWAYLGVEATLIIVFTYFYTAVQFNPVDQADNLRKNGGYVPGIRPGPPTAAYLDRVLQRLTLPGALFLAIIAVAPSIFIKYFGFSQATSRALGGTSVLIVVGVALDTMRQMESQMMMRSYEGFLK